MLIHQYDQATGLTIAEVARDELDGVGDLLVRVVLETWRWYKL